MNSRMQNADETGFSVGSIAGKVIGASSEVRYQISHLSGDHTKYRFSVMFCGCADGTIMFPFFIYPDPNHEDMIH
jgi:hypothetical protein